MTLLRNDQSIYERHGDRWWDSTDRVFASLRRINLFRLALLDRWLGGEVKGLRVVDLGCGGGLMAIPLAQRGARVIGVDLSGASLQCARRTAGRACAFARGDLRRVPLGDGVADLVLLADVLEHIARPADALCEAARLLRPGGAVFVNTINRSLRARLLAVTLGEGLRLIPRGTHDPALFVRPRELVEQAGRVGLRCERTQGEAVAVRATLRRWAIELRETPSLAVGYCALLRKEARA